MEELHYEVSIVITRVSLELLRMGHMQGRGKEVFQCDGQPYLGRLK